MNASRTLQPRPRQRAGSATRGGGAAFPGRARPRQLPLFGNDYWVLIATRAGVYWVLVSGLNLVVGFAGQLAIG